MVKKKVIFIHFGMFIFKVDQFIEFLMFSTLNVLISLGIFHWGTAINY